MQQNNSAAGSGDSGLECRVMVKIGAGMYQWELVGRPGRHARSDGESLPLDLMELGILGDELWWHVTTDSSTTTPIDSAGWSLVRLGLVISSFNTIRV